MPAPLTVICAAFLLGVVAAGASAQPLAFEKRYTVEAAPSLDVTTDSGNITVRTGAGDSVLIKGAVTVRSGRGVPANATDLARQVAAAPPVTQTGTVVQVGRIRDETIRKAVSIAYDITLPAAAMVTASSGSGSVSVSGVANEVKVNTGSGDISVSGIGGDVTLRSGSGRIVAKDVRGAANASTGSGNITAALSGRGNVKATTGSGDITLTGVHGVVEASTGSGTLDVDGTPAGDWKLSAASGDVAVRMPAEQGFTLEASTASGSLDVAAPLTIQGNVERRRIHGTVGGGGPTLRLSTASGDIAVR